MKYRRNGKVLVLAALICCLPLPSYAGFLKQLMNNVQIKDQGQTSRTETRQAIDPKMATPAPNEEDSLAIGDEYAGGTVFYLDDSGKHGLVAAGADIKGSRTWDEITAACKKYKQNGYSDWFLPNKDQLAELYLRRDVVGGWTPNNSYGFWSSTESDIRGCAWLQYFTTGNQYRNIQKNYFFYGRCVRAF